MFLFKLSKPTKKKSDKYIEHDQNKHLVDEMKNTAGVLPHYCVYFAWFLCLVTTLAAATFTLFYSLMWGKEIADQWLASILISSVQDIFIVQPTQLFVVVVSLVLSRIKSMGGDSVKEGERSDDDHDDDFKLLRDDPKQRFKEYQMDAIRERTKKKARLNVIVKDIFLHLAFVFLLAIVCYGNKNENRFLMTRTMMDPFMKFDLVRTNTENTKTYILITVFIVTKLRLLLKA